MNVLKIFDPRTWFPGDELADGMLESGLEDFLPKNPYPYSKTDDGENTDS